MCWVQFQGRTGPSPCNGVSEWEIPGPGRARLPWGGAGSHNHREPLPPATCIFHQGEGITSEAEGIEWEMVSRVSGQLDPWGVN